MEQNTALTTFEFQGKTFRVIVHKGGFWFIGYEACEVLGIANSRDAISRLSPHQKDDVGISDAIGRMQQTKIISEGGLYKLAFRSHKPEAEAFTDKVVDEVLPSIRKTGMYSTAPALTQGLEERVARLEQLVAQKTAPRITTGATEEAIEWGAFFMT